MPEWTIPLALTVAISFVISAPINRFAHPIYDRISKYLEPFERNVRHPDEMPLSFGDSNAVDIGLGKIGEAVFLQLSKSTKVMGLDSDQDCIDIHKINGINALYADSESPTFWRDVDLSNLELFVLCLNNAEAQIITTKKLREAGFNGIICGHSFHEDDAAQIEMAGANKTYITMAEAGSGLAAHAVEQLRGKTGINIV